MSWSDIKNLLEKQANTFEEFKQVNDDRLKSLGEGNEAKARELDEKLKRMESSMQNVANAAKDMEITMDQQKERIELLEARERAPGATKREQMENEYKSAFMDWMRDAKNPHAEARLRETARKAEAEFKDITIGTPAAGGYALPEEISRQIEELEIKISPVRRLVKVVQVGSNDYKELVSIHGGASGWVGETGSRTATGTPELRERAPTFGEIYAYPQVSEWALDDIFFDAAGWLVNDVAKDFARAEGQAVLNGNGTNKPTGIFNTTPVLTADEASPMRAAAAIQYVPLVGASSPVSLNGDSIINLVYNVNSIYRANGVFAMNSLSLAAVRRLKTSNGDYIWEPNFQAGEPPRVLGYPVENWEDMPAIADTAFPIAFGDWKRGYVLAERVGLRITSENVTNVGYVRFYIRRREGGTVLNNDAIKALRIED